MHWIRIIVLVLCISSQSQAKSATWDSTYKEVVDSVAIVVHAGGICSGALVAPNTTLTAAHCVDALFNTYVTYGKQEARATIVELSQNADIAILRHRAFTSTKPLAILAPEEQVQIGSPLATIGHPSIGAAFKNPPYNKDYTFLLSQGVLSKNTKKEIISDMSLSPGNSGGPVFTKDAKLVGVVSRKRIDLGAGNIGFSANHVQVINSIEAAKNKTTPVPFHKAKTRMINQFGIVNLSPKTTTGTDWDSLITFDLGLSFFSRLDLSGRFALNRPNEMKDFLDIRLAYRLGLELGNHAYLVFSPTYSSLRINEQTVKGFGLKISHTQLPLSIAFMQYDKDSVLGELSSIEFNFGGSF